MPLPIRENPRCPVSWAVGENPLASSLPVCKKGETETPILSSLSCPSRASRQPPFARRSNSPFFFLDLLREKLQTGFPSSISLARMDSRPSPSLH
ncbi:hypothetical protein MA16_Dca024595 [Dendrobium catenatum]|uniref:Uncharacterized protein n=1 Tax=Dendrobium catenatum TaxID=906689 RepID=A0A2I0X303_9ASPA|nr:hypothetical protein MA16_Dca024595 [Dendrobium catenatum]